MAQVVWSDAAVAGVERIRGFIATDNPIAAGRVAQQLINAGNSLEDLPFRGVGLGGDRRKLVVTPYLIFYRVSTDGAQVAILAVKDGRQQR